MSAGQTILVTGGVGGLGLAICKLYLSQGATVIAVDLRPSAEPLAGLIFIAADITDPAQREAVFGEVAARGLTIDILINNAAITRTHDYTNPFTLSADRARAEIEINFHAPVEMCRLYLDARRREGREDAPGHIVNVGAPGGLFPLEAIPLYSASKAGLHMFTMALRRQLRATAVKVSEVFPPSLDTPLANDIQVGDQAANGAEVIAQVAAGLVAGVAAGEDVIAPDRKTKKMLHMLPQISEKFIDAVNSGVVRRPGWDQA